MGIPVIMHLGVEVNGGVEGVQGVGVTIVEVVSKDLISLLVGGVKVMCLRWRLTIGYRIAPSTSSAGNLGGNHILLITQIILLVLLGRGKTSRGII